MLPRYDEMLLCSCLSLLTTCDTSWKTPVGWGVWENLGGLPFLWLVLTCCLEQRGWHCLASSLWQWLLWQHHWRWKRQRKEELQPRKGVGQGGPRVTGHLFPIVVARKQHPSCDHFVFRCVAKTIQTKLSSEARSIFPQTSLWYIDGWKNLIKEMWFICPWALITSQWSMTGKKNK